MSYKLGVADTQLEKLHTATRLGVKLDEALLYANISVYIYDAWLKNYKFKCYIDAKEFIDESAKNGVDILEPELLKINQDYEAPTMAQLEQYKSMKELYKKNEEYKAYVQKCWSIIHELKIDRVWTKTKLLDDLMKASEKQTVNWAASEHLLEKLFPQEFAISEPAPENNTTIKAIQIECVNSSSEEQDKRIARIEEDIMKDIERKA